MLSVSGVFVKGIFLSFYRSKSWVRGSFGGGVRSESSTLIRSSSSTKQLLDEVEGVHAVLLVWYVFTELGSIAENGAAMGAPVPSWLLSLLAESKEKAAK